MFRPLTIVYKLHLVYICDKFYSRVRNSQGKQYSYFFTRSNFRCFNAALYHKDPYHKTKASHEQTCYTYWSKVSTSS